MARCKALTGSAVKRLRYEGQFGTRAYAMVSCMLTGNYTAEHCNLMSPCFQVNPAV